MSGFLTMLKLNLKLLLRNKGYLSFLIILPIISVIMLNVENSSIVDDQEGIYTIHELEKESELILNVVNTKLSVKVYDCSNTQLSDYIIEELAKTGSYLIYRYRGETMDREEVKEKALNSANHNVIGAVIYIPESFENEILSNAENSAIVLKATEDGRISLLESNLDSYLQSLYRYAAVTKFDKAALEALLYTSNENEMEKNIVSIEVGDKLNLTKQQQDHGTSIGYSLAFLTIGFLFSGVFIAATVVEERQNRVYNRIVLSLASLGNYGLIKLVMTFITVLLQTGIIGIAIKLLVKTEFGISFGSYLFFVFCLGLIFNLFSVVIGVLTNNVLTSNYIAFLVWCLSALLAGLYFPLDGASGWWAKISLLMPQRWVIKAAELLMAGKSGVYSMYVLVVISYIIVIMSVGLMGIAIRRKE
jgi:ABC-2 type transport system permease protein